MPITKDQLAHDIEYQQRRLDDLLARLSPDDMLTPGAVGEWSVKDVLAHIAEWEQRFLAWYRAHMRGETSEVQVYGLGQRDLDALNRRIYEQHRDRPLDDVLEEYRRSYAETRAAIADVAAQDIAVVGAFPWVGPDLALSDIAAANTSQHYADHRDDLERWLLARRAS